MPTSVTITLPDNTCPATGILGVPVYALTAFNATETLPALTSVGSFRTISGIGTLPHLTGDGQFEDPDHVTGAANLPGPLVGAGSIGGMQATSTLPALTGTGAGTIPVYLRGAATLPSLTGAGHAILTGFLTGLPVTLPSLIGAGRFGLRFGNQTLPALDGAGALSTPLHLSTLLSGQLPALRGAGHIGAVGTVLHGAGQILPMLVGISGHLTNGTVGGAEASQGLPALVGLGSITNDTVATRQAWAMNIKGGEVTQFTEFPFRAFASAFGHYWGVGLDTGFYRMEGDDDAGTPIDWEWETGLSDLGTRAIKGVLGVYIEGVVEPGCTLTLRTDSGKYTYTHQPHGTKNDHKPQRVSTGRGVRTCNVGLGMASSKGAYFEIASLTPDYVISNRNL